MSGQISPEALAELRTAVRHFLDDDTDRLGFVGLVKSLHSLPLAERTVAYEYLVSEAVAGTSAGDPVRVHILGRIADLVGREPPEVATRVVPLLRQAC